MNWFNKKTADPKALAAIDTAVRSMLVREPFFAHVAMGFRLQETDKIETCSTDGETFFYNAGYIKGQLPRQLEGMIAHETLHAAYRHPHRGEGLDPKLWNVAADIQVNHILQQHGFMLPEGAAVVSPDHAVDRTTNKGRSVEEIYNLLEQQKQQGGGGKNPNGGKMPQAGTVEMPNPDDKKHDGPPAREPGEGNQDGDDEGEGQGQKDADDQERDLKRRVIKAALEARKQGKMPGDLESILDELKYGRKDWRDSFRRYLGGGAIPEQTWSRPNRRYIAEGDYLPGQGKFGPGEIVLAIDSSGSIDDSLLAKFMAEIRKINEDVQPEKIHVVVCDAQVQWTCTFGPYDEVTAKAIGRGGTDFVPVFDWVRNQGINPKALVYFTDLYGRFPDAPDYPVAWIVWPGGGNAVPFGELISMTN